MKQTIAMAALAVAAVLLLGCNGQSQVRPLFSSDSPQTTAPGGNSSDNSASFNYNVCTASGNGNTIVCNPSRVEFTEQIGLQLLAHMPDSKMPILLTTVGPSSADQSVGSQVQQYLTNRGRTVRRLSVGQMVTAPNYPFSLQVNGNQYELTVAPSAH